MRIEEHSFLRHFRDKARRRILASSQTLLYGNGQVVFQEDDPSDCMYLILSGCVELTKRTQADQTIVLSQLGAGEFLGDMGIVGNCGRSTGAIAVEPTTLATIPGDVLLDVLRNESAEVCLDMLGEVSSRLRKTNGLLVSEVLHKEKMHMVGQMARSLIQNFQNPITAVECATALIKKKSPDPDILRYVDLIEERVSVMIEMTQDLLDYSVGRIQLLLEEVSLNELVHLAEDMNVDYMQKNKVSSVFRGTDLRVKVDRRRILQVLQALLNNAVQSFGPEGGEVRVEACAPEAGMAVIKVSDNGPALSEGVRERLFEPFAKSQRSKGLGLGLAVVKTMMDAHGGSVECSSEPGKGTVFVLRLPLKQ